MKTNDVDMLFHENRLYQRGYTAIAGVDEAGRGPLCGPVYAAAVIFPKGFFREEINDSKKLTEKKREALYDIILENASAFISPSVCSVSGACTDTMSDFASSSSNSTRS